MVGNHVADLVDRYGDTGGGRAAGSHRLHQRVERATTTPSTAEAGNVHTDFVPDDVIDRFCILGDENHHISRLQELRDLGVDQFAIYLMHDSKDETLNAYGQRIIPALRD